MMQKILLFIFGLLLSFNIQAAIHVYDDVGNSVELAYPAKRIVSLAPGITDMLAMLGAGTEVVGTVEHSDYLSNNQKVKNVGTYADPDLEAIVLLHPDIVFVWGSGNPPHLIQKLQALHLPVYVMWPKKIADITTNIHRLGVLTGRQAAAKTINNNFNDGWQALKKQYQHKQPVTVFYQIWREPLISIGQNNLINAVISMCGGKNIMHDLVVPYARVNIANVLAGDPEIIILSNKGSLAYWQQYPYLQAVKKQHVYFIAANDIQRYSPRILRGAKKLCYYLDQARN